MIGEFPGLAASLSKKRTIRQPENPMDKSTIISIYPKAITETKHTIQPGVFHIDAGSYEKPALLVVGSSSWFREIDEDQPLVEIPTGSIQIAAAFVRDFCNGLYACDMQVMMPGLLWVPGNFDDIAKFKVTKFKDLGNVTGQTLLDQANTKQKAYFQRLVELTDGLWSRSNGNPLVISEDARLAAKELHLVDRAWMKDHTTLNKVECTACGNLVNPKFPVCPVCKAIWDVNRAKELNIQFAK